MAASTLASESATSTAVTAAASLPGDVIFEILSRTPVKSVCRFRCVSKGWRALISDPAFVAAHKTRVEPLLVTKNFTNQSELRLMDMDGNVIKTIKGGGGSVVLCTSLDDLVFVISGPDCHCARLIDPATEEEVLVTLPEPYDYTHIYGFGRAVPSGAYKIVCFIDRRPETCEVLTLGDEAAGWKKTKQPPSTRISCVAGSPVAVNGVMYFLRSCKGDNLLCFDLEEEEWKARKGPRKLIGNKPWKRMTKEVRVTELNGVACMVQSVAGKYESPCTNLWLLKDFDKDIWIKAFTIPLRSFSLMMPLTMTCSDGGKLLFYVGNTWELELHVYNPRTKVCTRIRRYLAVITVVQSALAP